MVIGWKYLLFNDSNHFDS